MVVKSGSLLYYSYISPTLTFLHSNPKNSRVENFVKTFFSDMRR